MSWTEVYLAKKKNLDKWTLDSTIVGIESEFVLEQISACILTLPQLSMWAFTDMLGKLSAGDWENVAFTSP